jgi:hypothetical protein
MSITTHMQNITDCKMHCEHPGNMWTVRFEDDTFGTAYMTFPTSLAEAIVDEWNEYQEKLRTYSREQLIAEDL